MCGPVCCGEVYCGRICRGKGVHCLNFIRPDVINNAILTTLQINSSNLPPKLTGANMTVANLASPKWPGTKTNVRQNVRVQMTGANTLPITYMPSNFPIFLGGLIECSILNVTKLKEGY